MDLLEFITAHILRNPPVLLGLISMLGLLLQRKDAASVIKGTFLAAFGMLILQEGVNILVQTILPINAAFQSVSGAVAESGLDADTFTGTYGGDVGMAMFIGLILHLLIARFTKFKTVFLTGHMLWWFPFIFVAAGVEAGLTGTKLVIISAIFSALYWSIMPWVLRKYVFACTDDDSFTIGHPTGMLSLVAGFVASKVGNKEKSTEDLDLPKGLSFFREVSITGGFVLLLMTLIVSLVVPDTVPEGENIFMMSLNQGLKFGAGLIIMLSGVRLLIGQIIPAFQGISEKLIPDALPAFDCPILFNYKPNAVLIGFLTAMIVSTALILFCDANNTFSVMLIPIVITSFFECGAAAVIAEGQGGLRGCIVGTAVSAVLMVVLLGFSAVAYGNTIQDWMLIFGGNDLSLFGLIAIAIGKLFA